ncbi:hypothetical protein [Aegicerativicinus sediminis]|uniref:hypothetical protein n=1 Tax=Aegicerativicinus sediminis TaxID=2893202 RepID=UPI001E3AAF98|nr:hypothetical protein [Aegicerativicinus sediminis]
MKIFIIILQILALGLIIFNLFQIDWNNPLQTESNTAAITILASLCAILLLQILKYSKKIERLAKNK